MVEMKGWEPEIEETTEEIEEIVEVVEENDLTRGLDASRTPGGMLGFIEAPNNIHNCEECPLNCGQTHPCWVLPCGQYHCWVETTAT